MAGQRVFNRPQNQRQRRAQLVAHVAEKSRLCPIQFGQASRALLLFFIGLGIGNAGGYLAGCKVQKPCVTRIELAIRIQRGDENPTGLPALRAHDRNQPRPRRRLVPDPSGQRTEKLAKVVHA